MCLEGALERAVGAVRRVGVALPVQPLGSMRDLGHADIVSRLQSVQDIGRSGDFLCMNRIIPSVTLWRSSLEIAVGP